MIYAGDEDEGWCQAEDESYFAEYGWDEGPEDYEPNPYDGTYSEC